MNVDHEFEKEMEGRQYGPEERADARAWFEAGVNASRRRYAHLESLIEELDRYSPRMGYNDSYFGEPAGLVKQITRQMVKA